MIWVIAFWLAACIADELTSWYSTKFADLREVNPLARTLTGRFDLKKGLIAKGAATAGLAILTAFSRLPGLILFGVLGGVTFFSAGWNLWIELHDKSARS